jgi:protein-disulfide isomerase
MANQQAQAQPPSSGGGMNTGVAVIAMILCFMAGMGLMWGYDKNQKIGADSSGQSASAGPAWSDDESPIPVSSKDPTWGKRDALVTIVIFSDFQCPYCSKVEPTMEQLRKEYGEGKLRLVWKNMPLPFHNNAKPAGEAAQGVFVLAGADAFWKFHASAFKNQQSLTADNFEKWAKEAGVKDIVKFKDGLTKHTWADKVDKDEAVAKASGVNGTPAFFINGVNLSGAQPYDKFKAVVDAELKKATERVGKGLSKDKVYVEMSKENKKNAPKEEKDEEEKEDTKTVWKIPVGNSPVKGPKGAAITIIEFSDFECPYCSRVEPTLNKVFETYKDKVRLVWKHEILPFHKKARPAAYLSFEARAQKGDEGFWKAHDKIFENQKDLSDDNLSKIAGELGLNVAKYKAALKEEKYEAAIEADQEAAEAFKANGTPHFFINGRRLSGAQPFENFQKVIDEEIKRAEGMKGVAPEKLYDALIKDGKEPPPEPEPEKKVLGAPPPSAPSKGPATAKVTVQIFSDFQCPYCSRVEPTLATLQKKYEGKVRWVWRDMPLPFHKGAEPASEFAREAMKQKGADAFWKAHDALFAKQAELFVKGELDREKLDVLAKELGLNMDKYKAAIDGSTYKALIDADKEAASKAGIQGTPAFVINGYFLNGAQPLPKFKKLIDRALAEAK